MYPRRKIKDFYKHSPRKARERVGVTEIGNHPLLHAQPEYLMQGLLPPEQ